MNHTSQKNGNDLRRIDRQLGFFILLMTLLYLACSVRGEIDPGRAISSGRNDVVYLAPASEPYEALPLGNGQLGVMMRNQRGITWLFNHGSFFANAEQDNDLLSSGEVILGLPEDWQRGLVEQRLVLHDATVVTRYRTGSDTHTVTSWMAEGLDLLVVQVESTASLPDLPVSLGIWDRGASPISKAAVREADILLSTLGDGARRATALAVRSLEGKANSTVVRDLRATMQVICNSDKHVTVFVSCPVVLGDKLSHDDASRAARGLLTQAAAKGLTALRKEYDRYWRDYWAKSGVLMHSEDGLADYVENLYHLHLYWMACLSRGPEAPKFNGGNLLFCHDWRSWGGYYWYQNTRELFWPVLPASHPELFKPLIDLYWRNLPAARKLAKDLFNAPGACYHETMGRTGNGDKANNTYTCLYHTTGTEIAHQFYQYYLYTRDEAFLTEKAYPLMKEVIAFHLSFLAREADGLYHVYPSNARETYWWIKDSITDLAALRATLPILIRQSERFGRDADQRAHWAEVLAHLASYPADEAKNVFLPGSFLDTFPPTMYTRPEQLYPKDKSRTLKAQSNSFNFENVDCDPIWPWGLMGLDSPAADYERARETFFKRRFKEWSYGNAWDPSALMAARLGLGDEMVKCLSQYVRNVQEFPCGLPGTPGNAPKTWGGQIGDSPGLDAAGVLAMAVAEMQLQSYGGVIRVFPAWPKGWQSQFNLVAEGGFLVSSQIGKMKLPSKTELQRVRQKLCALGRFTLMAHFENSKVMDIRARGEHGISMRRCTSTGSRMFIEEATIAPLTVQDCQVSGWTNSTRAITLGSGPVVLFDCTFVNPPTHHPPITLCNGQHLILSNNKNLGTDGLVKPEISRNITEVPAGKLGGSLNSPLLTFFQDGVRIPGKVFDASRDFGAKGDGKTDDSTAAQAAINAARALGQGAIAYFPSGAYQVPSTL